MSKNPGGCAASRNSWRIAVAVAAIGAGCRPENAGVGRDDGGITDAFIAPADENPPRPCAHPICTTGVKLEASCDPCAKKLCAKDPYCCSTSWNAMCVSEVPSLCEKPCDIPDLRHDPPDIGGGSVGPGGGSVPSLLFAVVGDTRPNNIDDTANYPTAVIQKIYSDLEGMAPRPQFAVATGDYIFATPTGTEGAAQLALYQHATQLYSGTVFAALGNHECDGYTADNCAGTSTNSLTAFIDTLVKPLGKTLPYYSIPISALDSSWTAKVIILACNDWDSTQKSWLATQLGTRTSYTFVVRHEQAAETRGPCVNDVEALLATNPYNLSLVGHAHYFQVNGKEIIVGNGGAPLTTGVWGYTIIEQTTSGFRVTNYDYATAAAVFSTTVPF